MKFMFILPVWGKDYVELFTDTCLPMLLTPGNFLTFSGRDNCTLFIATDYESWAFMEQQESIKQLKEIIKVKYALVDGLVDTIVPHTGMTECYYLGMRDESVIPEKTNFVYLTPDSFWSDGTFADLEKSADNGKKVVASLGVRTKKSRMTRYLRRFTSRNFEDRVIPNRDLVKACLKFLHPLARGHIWNGDSFLSRWPSNIYWLIDNKKIISRNFHLHPLMMQCPRNLPKTQDTIDGDFIEKTGIKFDEIDVVTNSDRFLGLEMSPDDRGWGTKLTRPVMRHVREFARWQIKPVHWHFFSYRVEYVAEDIDSEFLNKHIDEVCAEVYRSKKVSMFLNYIGFTKTLIFINTVAKRIILRMLSIAKRLF